MHMENDNEPPNKEIEPEEEGQYSTVNETADLLRVSTKKLRQWIREGLIEVRPAKWKYGPLKIPMRAIQKFIEKYTTSKHEQ